MFHKQWEDKPILTPSNVWTSKYYNCAGVHDIGWKSL